MWDIFAETLFDHLFPVCFLHAVPAKLRRSKQLSMLLRQSQVLNSADKEIKAKLSSRDRLGCAGSQLAQGLKVQLFGLQTLPGRLC